MTWDMVIILVGAAIIAGTIELIKDLRGAWQINQVIRELREIKAWQERLSAFRDGFEAGVELAERCAEIEARVKE